jgi:putative aminopeptidase FrvX
VPIPDSLRSLLTAPGPSGYEAPAAEAFRAAAREVVDDVTWDTVGSTVARLRGSGDGPLVAVVGHIDEIGLIISHIDDKGFLRFRQVGGWDPVVLVGQRVEIVTRDGPVTGVIARKPAHVLEEDERKAAPEIKRLHIDVGARDADEARTLVRIGDIAVLAGEPIELPNGRIVSRALDNRLGCWAALEVARFVKEAGGAAADVAAVAASQEELVRTGGAAPVAYALEPDLAIVVDVTWETGQPGVEPGETPPMEMGAGPVIARGPQLHPAISDGLIAVAERDEIPHVVEATGRGTMTDADSIYLVRAGIPTGLVSFPTRYLHSPVEMVELSDVEAAAKVIAGYVLGLEASADFRR